jgi:hypothetical protein
LLATLAGLSAPYARALTKQTGNMASLWWCAFNWKHEPGPRPLKLAILALLLLVPLLCGLLGILAGVSYSGITVRVTTQQLNTTSISDWITYDNLIKARWTAGSLLSNEYPQLARSDLMTASTSKEETFRGSGLPTIRTTDEEGNPRSIAYLGNIGLC